MELVDRPSFMQRIERLIDVDAIKVLTGLRRSGKSRLLELVVQLLRRMHALFGYSDRRLPGVLENIVWLELRRRGYDVTVGRVGQAEWGPHCHPSRRDGIRPSSHNHSRI